MFLDILRYIDGMRLMVFLKLLIFEAAFMFFFTLRKVKYIEIKRNSALIIKVILKKIKLRNIT